MKNKETVLGTYMKDRSRKTIFEVQGSVACLVRKLQHRTLIASVPQHCTVDHRKFSTMPPITPNSQASRSQSASQWALQALALAILVSGNRAATNLPGTLANFQQHVMLPRVQVLMVGLFAYKLNGILPHGWLLKLWSPFGSLVYYGT